MAGKVKWAQFPGKHAYSVEGTVGPWNCKNDTLDVMLVQLFLKAFFDEKRSYDYPLGKTIEVDGRYGRTTHYWTMMFKWCNNVGDWNQQRKVHVFQPLMSLTPHFLDTDTATDLMECINRNYSKHNQSKFKDLSVAPGVPPALQARLKIWGYTL